MSGLNELVLDCALRRESDEVLPWENALGRGEFLETSSCDKEKHP